jgi:hypothetical protein
MADIDGFDEEHIAQSSLTQQSGARQEIVVSAVMNSAQAVAEKQREAYGTDSTQTGAKRCRIVPGERAPRKRLRERHPDEPPPCEVHGQTTVRCTVCGQRRCWRAPPADASPPLGFEEICEQCIAKRTIMNSRIRFAPGANAAIVAAKIARAKHVAKTEHNRPSTASGKANKVANIRQWGNKHKVVLFPPAMDPEIAAWYIQERTDGSQQCNKVTFATVRADIKAAEEWAENDEESSGIPARQLQHFEVVQHMLRYAKDTCKTGGADTKDPATRAEFEAYITAKEHQAAASSGHTAFLANMYIVIAIGIAFSLARRRAFGQIQFTGVNRPMQLTETELERVEAAVHFSIDADGDKSVRLLVSNEKHRTKSSESTRFFGDSNVMSIKAATRFEEALIRMRMKPGLLVRRTALATTTEFTQDDWAAWASDFADITTMSRKKVGTTTLRKTYATEMSRAGVSSSNIQAIGYWVSDAYKLYRGAAREERLRAQKPSSLSHQLVKQMQEGTDQLRAILQEVREVAKQQPATALVAAATRTTSAAAVPATSQKVTASFESLMSDVDGW